MNRTELRRRLTGVSIEKRVPIIQEYFQELPKEELQRYRKFYETSVKTLRQCRGVTKAKNILENNGSLDPFGRIHYSTLHQMACIAAGQPIKTPQTEMKDNGVKIKHHQKRRNLYHGKSIGRLAEQKPAKVRFGPKSADRYEKSD